ncbi:hypothetical protein BCR37DRAFT_376952 [Protomyces lactucae-debilis]|uniref:Uncharacterized protein n=1 Tax=Protomyces lactucae-debilis TaxID=2754530 RepID=A0A1Y2FQZ6_PROLT|nr:uncharacterized protein BCR37DRAFT_376952 [Protomyces lactucae-debilis]ORY86359.1 hypothetical protein BCR37DRAFT_376952 [Protomyces lactucae-debilis]
MSSSTHVSKKSPTDSLDESKRTSHGFSRTDSPSTKTLRLATALWPQTPLRDATWNNITAHARYLMETHQILVDAQGRTKVQTVIHKLEKAFPILERAHGHWIALIISRKAKVYREKTTAAAPQDDDLNDAHDVVHGASSARVDDENIRCEIPASVPFEDDDIDETASRVLQPTSSQHNVSLLCGGNIG